MIVVHCAATLSVLVDVPTINSYMHVSCFSEATLHVDGLCHTSCYSTTATFFPHSEQKPIQVICRKVHLDSTKCLTLDGTALSRTYAVRLVVKFHTVCYISQVSSLPSGTFTLLSTFLPCSDDGFRPLFDVFLGLHDQSNPRMLWPSPTSRIATAPTKRQWLIYRCPRLLSHQVKPSSWFSGKIQASHLRWSVPSTGACLGPGFDSRRGHLA